MKYLNAFIVGIMLAICLFNQNCSQKIIKIETDKFSNQEQILLGIKEIKITCDLINDCDCNALIENKFPVYNKLQIEHYIESKLNMECNFNYKGK